jgi:hypothetical protein
MPNSWRTVFVPITTATPCTAPGGGSCLDAPCAIGGDDRALVRDLVQCLKTRLSMPSTISSAVKVRRLAQICGSFSQSTVQSSEALPVTGLGADSLFSGSACEISQVLTRHIPVSSNRLSDGVPIRDPPLGPHFRSIIKPINPISAGARLDADLQPGGVDEVVRRRRGFSSSQRPIERANARPVQN